MDNKPKKIVTGLYFMTIVGYVTVGLVTLFSVYLGLSFLFGAFSQANKDLTGVQFKDQEITISTTGGTAEVTLFSPDGILQEQAEAAAKEQGKDVKQAVYRVSSIEIIIQDDMGNTIKENAPIKLPSMSDIHMGVPFEITANVNPAEDDEGGNYGGDCYLVAKVVDTEGKIYITKNAAHVFVDVPITKIKTVRVVPLGDIGEDEFFQGPEYDSNDNDKGVDKVTSVMYVDDKVKLEVEVSPARALSPHTALIYTDKRSDSYVAPKSMEFEFSDLSVFSSDVINFDTVFSFKKDFDDSYINVKIPSVYGGEEYATRQIKFQQIQKPEVGGIDIDFDSNFVESAGEYKNEYSLNVDMKVYYAESMPAVAFVLQSIDLAQLDANDEAVEFYRTMLENNKVINLNIRVRAGTETKPRASYNSLYPEILQSELDDLIVGVYDVYKVDSILTNELENTAITIDTVSLTENVKVYYVYVQREALSNEIVAVQFNDDSTEYSAFDVKINTVPIDRRETGWNNLFSDEVAYSSTAQATTYSCEIIKNGDLEEDVTLDSRIEIALNTALPCNSTYTKLIYLVKASNGGNLNLNSVNCHKVKVMDGSIDYNMATYNMLYQDNGEYKIIPVGGGIVDIYPFIVKTNAAGEPIDRNNNVITQENCRGAVNSSAATSPSADYCYIILPIENGIDGLNVLTMTITEKLTGFRFYNSLNFTEEIGDGKFIYDGNKLYALGNSTLALQQYSSFSNGSVSVNAVDTSLNSATHGNTYFRCFQYSFSGI